ncbi:hypothetical protein IMG5_179300, partial [Ichthyophthirius multifiliis]
IKTDQGIFYFYVLIILINCIKYVILVKFSVIKLLIIIVQTISIFQKCIFKENSQFRFQRKRSENKLVEFYFIKCSIILKKEQEIFSFKLISFSLLFYQIQALFFNIQEIIYSNVNIFKLSQEIIIKNFSYFYQSFSL